MLELEGPGHGEVLFILGEAYWSAGREEEARRAHEWALTLLADPERLEIRELVRGCINQLPENHRNVIVLRDIEGMSTKETARLLGLTPNAVKLRLHRARQALRTLLVPHFRGSRE